MKYFTGNIFAVLLICIFTSCKENKTAEAARSSSDAVSTAGSNFTIADNKKDDSIALTQLIRQAYAWKDSSFNTGGYLIPAKADPSDSTYTSMDKQENSSYLEKLVASHYFSEEFTGNYQRIVHYMDTSLRNGSAVWNDGELPPFNLDADLWCNCQDFPTDNYYSRMTISDLRTDGRKASFNWNIPEGNAYAVRAGKVNGQWKIDWLIGFDFKSFTNALILTGKN
ncbi:MAG: hypothetical protein ACTHMC_14035 [Pseudobacter sp.]|uniref:hypothetical protein n=1 Tax=Pseudobacter sp. TaxID=2045420 RepID=UPI003F81064D